MDLKSPDNKQPESMLKWMASERLYEKYFFFYALMMAGFVVIGLFTIGFELSGKTPFENWVFNVLWCFVLTFFISLTPFWHRLIFGRHSKMLKKGAAVYEKLDSISDIEERKKVEKELAFTGKLPPTKWQIAGMVFIAGYLLFEFCIASASVRDYQLVWEPQWLESLIKWGIENTSTPAESPPGLGGRFALFYARLERFDFLEYSIFSNITFNNEREFLHSSVGHVVMTFALWRLLSFIPVLIAFALVFGKMLGWLGLNGLNIRYAKNIVDFLGRVFFNLLIFIFLFAIFYSIDLSNSAESMISSSAWVGSLGIRLVMFIFALIPIILIIGWFSLIIQIIIKSIAKEVSFINGLKITR